MSGDCLYTTNLSNFVDRYTKDEPPAPKNSFALPDALVPNPVVSVTPEPDGIASAADGTAVWVTDFAQSRVVKMSPGGVLLDQFGSFGSGNGQFSWNPGPEGIAINQLSGDIYVCDRGNQRVQIFDANGNYLGQFGTPYVGPGTGWVQSHPAPSSTFDIPPPMEVDAPGQLRFFAAAFDATNGVTVIFGGEDAVAADTGKTWTWDGVVFTDVTPGTSPAAQSSAAMAYHGGSGKVVLFANDGSNETWEWDGGALTWTLLTPAASPSDGYATFHPGVMAYDAVNDQVVMFGGFGDGFPTADTNTWDGTNWTREAPGTSPPAADYAGAAVAWDVANTKIVLFGVGATYGNETWIWNGTDWTDAAPADSPPVRRSAGMAFHPSFGLVLFGGVKSGGATVWGDTWKWDGITWTSVPVAPPSIGSGSVYTPRAVPLVYDSLQGVVVIYGGYSGLASPIAYADTWQLMDVAASGGFLDPGGIAIDPVDGSVYVGDYELNFVQKFDAAGNFILGFGSTGTGDGQFDVPSGIAVDSGQNVWVNDQQDLAPPGRLQQFDLAGTFLQKHTHAFINGLFGLAIKPSTGSLYAVVGSFNSMSIWDPATGYVSAFASPSGGMAQCCFGPCTNPGHPVFNNHVRVSNG